MERDRGESWWTSTGCEWRASWLAWQARQSLGVARLLPPGTRRQPVPAGALPDGPAGASAVGMPVDTGPTGAASLSW